MGSLAAKLDGTGWVLNCLTKGLGVVDGLVVTRLLIVCSKTL